MYCIRLVAAFVFISTIWAQTTPLTGSHTDLPRWCGKPYPAGSPNYDPGGMLEPPAPQSSQLLDLRVQPRHSIYVSSESRGEFVVHAGLSRFHGQPYEGTTWPGKRFERLQFAIRVEGSRRPLVASAVVVNSTRNVFSFDLTKLQPRMEPYQVTLSASFTHGKASFHASSELYYLPEKRTGSTVKIDNLNGGMLIANNVSDYVFEPILPFGFYTSCSGYLNYSLANVSAYKAQGYTAINPVCAFPDGDLSYLFDWLDMVNMPFQYDMRGSYFNLSSVREQVALVKDYSALLSWYTADEPDGWQYSFDSTTSSYNLLKELDPYHPTGLVLNCQNYYFDQYTIGTDYIMEDAYPVGINATYSRPWDTPCNETYGDCGCDNCVGELEDVSNRLDDFYDYQDWLGRMQKPLWAVTQAFSGEGYWARDPTQAEAWAMDLLGINHRAKGVMNWDFPTSEALEQAHGALAKVVAASPVRDFVLGGQPAVLKVPGQAALDVSYWLHNGQMLVSIVNPGSADIQGLVRIPLPLRTGGISIMDEPWGSVSWSVHGNALQTMGLAGVSTSMVILKLSNPHVPYHGGA